MKTVTLDTEYNIKESLTYEEEGQVNILGSLMPIVIKMNDNEIFEDKTKTKGDDKFVEQLLELISNDEFRKKGLKLVEIMCLEPKLTEKELMLKDSSVILGLQLECIKVYIGGFGKYLGKKNNSQKAI